MTPTEQIANRASTPKTGLSATLRALLGADGSGAPSAPRRLTLAILLALLALLASLAFSTAPALAAHLFSVSFGGPCVVKPLEPCEGKFSEPSGVAVNEATDHVYVVDKGNNRVEYFSAAGTFEGQFNGSGLLLNEGQEAGSGGLPGEIKTGQFKGPEGIAVDNDPGSPSFGDVYVVDTGHSVIDKFSATGEYLGQITAGAGGAAFTELDGVAVDPAGVVWVYQNNSTVTREIDSYSDALSNEFSSSRKSPFGASPGFAVDSEDNLYVRRGEPHFAKLNSSGGTLIEEVDGEESTGAAVDLSTNDVYIDNVTSIAEFNAAPACTASTPCTTAPAEALIERFGEGHLTAGSGVAVNPATGTVYVADSAASTVSLFVGPISPVVKTGEATNLQTEGSATLNGTVNPRGVPLTECQFEYVQNSEYSPEAANPYEAGHSISCTPAAGTITGASPVAVQAEVSGLTPGMLYHFRLLAGNAEGGSQPGKDRTFFVTTHPQVTGESATDITSATATLNAQINPEGLDTTYRFEYGTSTSYGTTVPVPDADIGAGTSDVAVSQHIEGLTPNTTYHWRIIAHNILGTAPVVDHTFIYSTTGAELPDHRAYEMVTPPFKGGGAIGTTVFGFVPQVSADGSRVIAVDIQCFAPSESCNEEQKQGEPFEFTRTPAGWVTTALAPPATEFSETIPWLASPNAGTVLFSMAASPEAERHWYAREPNGAFVDIGPATPPGHSDIKSFDEGPWASTSDLSHLVWQQTSFDLEPWPFDGGSFLYEYVGASNSQPFLVAVTGEKGSTELLSTCGARLGNGTRGQSPNAVSADGRTVYFTAEGGGSCFGTGPINEHAEVPVGELYARIDGEEPDVEGSLRKPQTVAISEPQALAPGPRTECEATPCIENTSRANSGTAWREASYVGASTDGSKVFFTSEQQLTDTAVEGSANLYEFACPNRCEDQGSGHLTDLSAGSPSPAVAGALAISADGSHVYFVAQGKLAGNRSVLGNEAVPGEDNLYVSANGHVAFIATLPEDDSRSWKAVNAANVTPDGRFLVFGSRGALTPDDTRTNGAVQVFRYDAETGQLVRVSAGDRGFNDNGNSGTGNASIVFASSEERLGPARGDPTMSDDGEYVFFRSPIALTPRALNDVPSGGGLAQNVYEWHAGHVYLISDGKDTGAAFTPGDCETEERAVQVSAVCLLGTDSSGHNVFFTTDDRLVRSDTDTQVDVYDARICEPEKGNPCITEPPRPLPPCGGEACHGIPAAIPSGLAPGTATFNGEGNITPPPPTVVKPKTLTNAQNLTKALKACRAKHNKHKRSACEKAAHKKYASKATGKKAKRAGRATNHRGAGR